MMPMAATQLVVLTSHHLDLRHLRVEVKGHISQRLVQELGLVRWQALQK